MSEWRLLNVGRTKVRDDKLGIYFKVPEFYESLNSIIFEGTENAEEFPKYLDSKKPIKEKSQFTREKVGDKCKKSR